MKLGESIIWPEMLPSPLALQFTRIGVPGGAFFCLGGACFLTAGFFGASRSGSAWLSKAPLKISKALEEPSLPFFDTAFFSCFGVGRDFTATAFFSTFFSC
eukprot:CAMPEP_0182469562 /NCGR_PEP_ID=MMETSP1319-20130603/17290_1 /TAXON_ID=172717 /ORGANISM="Bolidomonas pacifica, Strain RCC208" /LENGTH=100 /DNA_ID=CAMNT_0024669879 /DNA_START=105 /DNA_END=404 /DNA_ORIENTATION=-